MIIKGFGIVFSEYDSCFLSVFFLNEKKHQDLHKIIESENCDLILFGKLDEFFVCTVTYLMLTRYLRYRLKKNKIKKK